MTATQNPFVPRCKHQTLAHIALVLDRSGSMRPLMREIAMGVNAYVRYVQKTAEERQIDVRLTLTIFNGTVHMPLVQSSPEEFRPLSPLNWRASGATRLYDALGRTIDKLRRHGTRIESAPVLIVVASDGRDNASHRIGVNALSSRAVRLAATGRWTFACLDLGQRAASTQIASALGIPMPNIAVCDATPSGARDAWDLQCRATGRYMDDISCGKRASRDFFAAEREIKSS